MKDISMSKLNSREIESVINLPASARYQYFIKKIADLEEVWSLKNADGWVLAFDTNKDEVVPVWSHAEYAKLCIADQWKDCSPKSINLEDWMGRWVPGMIKDKRKVLVFPTFLSRGVVVEVERLHVDLSQELSRFE